ncbi:MAG: DUF721 domain-containing protein [Prolixibacteraceae bacterium]|nr:DUF721 domain-containing protein [Burkholderiales bacterium]
MPFVKISPTSESRVGLLLNSLPELQALNRELRQLAELQSALAEVLPDNLATSTCVALVKTGELILFANNGAVAAKLRQMAPRILDAFRAHGHEITGIRVQVQVTIRDNPLPQKQISLSSGARRAIESLSERLIASPLKTALTRLGRNGR